MGERTAIGGTTFVVDDQVVVEGLDGGWEPGVVKSGEREDGKLLIGFPSGGDAWVPRAWVDAQTVGVERGRGRRQRDADPELLRLTVEAIADQLDFEHRLVLAELVAAGDVGMIDRDHHDRHGRAPAVIRHLRDHLTRLALVEDTGLTRPSVRKRRARVWRATARGRAVHAHLPT